MIASASAQIEATAGDKIRNPVTGKPEYGKVSAILIAAAASALILCCLVGAEDHGANFEKGRAAFEKDAGLDIGELIGCCEMRLTCAVEDADRQTSKSVGYGDDLKEQIDHKEKV